MSRRPIPTVLFLPDMDGGGAQRTFVNLANALARDWIDPIVIAGRADGPARSWLDSAVPLVDLGQMRLRTAIPALRRELRRLQPAVVLATIADANVVAWLATRGLPLRLILRETNSLRSRNDIGFLRMRLIASAYPRADAVVALSEGVRQELVDDLGLKSRLTRTIHNPVDVEAIATSVRCGVPAETPPGGPLVLGIGRLTRQKHFDLLIRSFAALPDRTARLVLLGDGPDRDVLQGLAFALGVADRVMMPGFVTDVAPWLARAQLFVLSSLWEGFGHVIVEAMAAGVPVIATDCPHGPRDIIADGDTGLLVKNDDQAALTAAMARLLSDSGLCSKLAEAGRLAASAFAPARIAARYAELITEIASD